MAQQIPEITSIPSNSNVLKILNQIIKRYNSLADIYTFKGSVETYDDLLAIQNPNIGDVYNVKQEDTEHGVAAGSNFVWDGTVWDNLGMSLDGLVRKINGFTPDDLGSVIFKYIKSIEDEDGTLNITVREGESETQLTIQTGKVKTVNGVEPDTEGNIQITTNEGVWQANEEVEAGDMRYLAGRDNTGYLLEYVGAGTTGQTQPVVQAPTEIANYSAVDRIGKMRMIFNLAEKDVDEIFACGVIYNRATYSELWNYVQLKPSLLISEAEWQAKYTQTGGKFVPFYSEGNGTTTFRTPLLSAYPCGVASPDNIGTYASDGLPNIEATATYATGVYYAGGTHEPQVSGAIKAVNESTMHINALGGNDHRFFNVEFNASLSNPIYGNADEVRPKTMYGIWVIKAVGVVVDSVGNTDLQSMLNGLNQLQEKLTNLQNQIADSNNFTIIYPNGGTKESPANITINERYIETNPFSGYHVLCIPQILLNNEWAQPFMSYVSADNGGRGVTAGEVNNQIIIQTGRNYLKMAGYDSGSLNSSNESVTTAPCRVLVYKLGKIESEE